MKKILTVLLLLCLAVPAQAQIVGMTSSGENIHVFTAENGQQIYFTALEEEPFVTQQDVNFDGADDLVVCVSAGASNGFFEFFVWDGEKYVQAGHDGIGHGVCNYQLFPEKGLVLSRRNDGQAGALHDWCLFAWEGTDLMLLRRAESEEYYEFTSDEDSFTMKYYPGQIQVTVSEYGENAYESTVLLEEVVRQIDEDFMAREEEAFWRGL